MTERDVREKYSVLAGVLGIICNLFLFGLKIFIGWSVNSIAVISDAFNNLSDTGTAFVTIIGAKLSNKRADRGHPYGHGRLEYVSTLIVSFLIIHVGVDMISKSFKKIINPDQVSMSVTMLIILALSLGVKVWMYSYNMYISKSINSAVLKAAAIDSKNDVIATSAVIAASYAGQFFPSIPVDGIVGLLVAILIIKTGFGIATETVNSLLGASPDHELVKKLKAEIIETEGIIGVHDLLVHDYGPGRVIASVHAEVPDDADVVKIHEVIDYTEKRIASELGIELVIHMDPVSVDCEATNAIKNEISLIAREVHPEFTIHDFRMTDGEQNVNLIFDLVTPCDLKDDERDRLAAEVVNRIKEEDSRYSVVINIDIDYLGN